MGRSRGSPAGTPYSSMPKTVGRSAEGRGGGEQHQQQGADWLLFTSPGVGSPQSYYTWQGAGAMTPPPMTRGGPSGTGGVGSVGSGR